ncbi:unnamed protein product [Anisakis simplex]|uniref:Uncharacterized protein n=1 Tax=Anisakis simplex TaxID=6269 RepID=A0A3P6RHL4_ANISI|nr:unnamed protein product [Anisakis simplex]
MTCAPPLIETQLINHLSHLIQEIDSVENGIDIKLRGTAWVPTNFEQAASAKRIFLTLFRHFNSAGYHFLCSGSLRGQTKSDVFFFRKHLKCCSDSNYFLISYERKDRLRVFEAPPETLSCIDAVVKNHWSRGIQETKTTYVNNFLIIDNVAKPPANYKNFLRTNVGHEVRIIQLGCAEFKLAGNPFYTDGDELLETQRMSMELVKKMSDIGWKLITSVTLSQRISDKCCLIFESSTPRKMNIFAISPAKSDLLRLLNAPFEIRATVKKIIEEFWLRGIQETG